MDPLHTNGPLSTGVIAVAADNTHSGDTVDMTPTDEIATLAADPQILRRLAATLTPQYVTRRVGEAIAFQLASTGPMSATDTRPTGINIGYTAVAPLTTASLFAYLREQCGDMVAVLGCETATSTQAVGSSSIDHHGPLIDPNVRLTICDAIAHEDATLWTTIERAITSGEVPLETSPRYVTRSPTNAVAVGQTCTTVDANPFDDRIRACLDCIIPLQLAGDRSPATDSDETSMDVEPVPESMLSPYFEAVWSIAPTVTPEATERWQTYKSDHAPGVWPRWMRVGSTPTAETVPKLATALARLKLAETTTVKHLTTAIEWFETGRSRPPVMDPHGRDLSADED